MSGEGKGKLWGGASAGDCSYLITVLLGVLVWAGLYLREDRLRPLLPLRS
jgi:hypothetical protein